MQFYKCLLFIVIPVIILLSAGCKKKSGNFQLNVKAVYGNQFLAVSGSNAFPSDTYNIDPAGRYIEVQNLQFFLTHMCLVKSGGSLVKVTDLGFFDIGNPSTLTVSDIQGDFTGIQFYCGLDSLQDTIMSASNPNFPPGLLAGGSMFWNMFQYYQFENVSGKWDSAWLPIMRNAFLYHVGGYNYLYKPVSINSSFSVCCGSTTTKTLTLDFEKIFYTGSAQTLNIDTQSSTMSDSIVGSADELVIARQFAANFANAFSLQ